MKPLSFTFNPLMRPVHKLAKLRKVKPINCDPSNHTRHYICDHVRGIGLVDDCSYEHLRVRIFVMNEVLIPKIFKVVEHGERLQLRLKNCCLVEMLSGLRLLEANKVTDNCRIPKTFDYYIFMTGPNLFALNRSQSSDTTFQVFGVECDASQDLCSWTIKQHHLFSIRIIFDVQTGRC